MVKEYILCDSCTCYMTLMLVLVCSLIMVGGIDKPSSSKLGQLRTVIPILDMSGGIDGRWGWWFLGTSTLVSFSFNFLTVLSQSGNNSQPSSLLIQHPGGVI